MLTFDTKEVVLPTVPLGWTSEAIFYVINEGYEQLELQYKLPLDKDQIPLKLEFPGNDPIGIRVILIFFLEGSYVDSTPKYERIPVLVSLTTDKPLCFTSQISFFDRVYFWFNYIVILLFSNRKDKNLPSESLVPLTIAC
jgi:hypothetical protein